MKAAIIDYEMGNVASVQKALNYLNIPNEITNNHEQISSADVIILPGVGSFEKGMQNLHRLNLIQVLTDQVIHRKKAFLGICLGMQLIATTGYEPVKTPGLNWIEGEVIKIPQNGKRIPHMGWNEITVVNDRYFGNLPGRDFYFIHSYHFKVSDRKLVSSIVNYTDTLVASVQKDNIFATQFHPEKSQKTGIALLKFFFNNNA